ncbi:MAG: RluA family pseudouridine synthase [Clostridia bacterium]
MKEFIITKNDSGQRLDKFVAKAVPLLPKSLFNKYIRLKRIKCNGKKCEISYKLQENDVLQMYINDEFFENNTEEYAFLKIKSDIKIVYEDENILLVDKKPGVVVHSDKDGDLNTLITHIKAYLYETKQYKPQEELSFTPSLCNRIDRNTGGIVIACKNAEALRIMNDKVKFHEMEKKYLCIVTGVPQHKSGTFSNYLLKNEKENKVMVYNNQVRGSKTAITHYKVLKSKNDLSLVECNLVTGRTHQIRAQFAYAGHPLLGDGKYGANKTNKEHSRFRQALYSYKLKFAWKNDAGILNYLNNQEFCVEKVDFAENF